MPIKNHIRNCVLVIGGSDSAGLAGVQADSRALQACGVHSLQIISAVTAQNNRQLISVNTVSDAVFRDQWRACQDFSPLVIKVGLICSDNQITFLLDNIEPEQILVWDPVQASSSGTAMNPQCSRDNMLALLQRCDLVTPNIAEASYLLNAPIESSDDIEDAAKQLCEIGATSTLITGGDRHLSDKHCRDFLYTSKPVNTQHPQPKFWLITQRVSTDNTRGTGCTLASLVAAQLASGHFVEDACTIAKSMLTLGLSQSCAIASHNRSQKGYPLLSATAADKTPIHAVNTLPKIDYHFKQCREKPINFGDCHLPCGKQQAIGIYPVVDSAAWVEKLVCPSVGSETPAGITMVQLRIKHLTGSALLREIEHAVAIANAANCRLFVNDYWAQAIEAGAYGVHLGQEDLYNADLELIQKSGLRLGVSNHAYYEIANTLSRVKPSYLAFGPIFPTRSKQMPWQQQGLNRLNALVASCDIPVVAIGGIGRDNIQDVISSSVDGIAMISAITQANHPANTAKAFVELFYRNRQ